MTFKKSDKPEVGPTSRFINDKLQGRNTCLTEPDFVIMITPPSSSFNSIPQFVSLSCEACSGGYFRCRSRICGRLVDNDLSRRMKNHFRFLIMIMNSNVDLTNNARAANETKRGSGAAWRDLHAGERARSNSFSFKRYIDFETQK